MPLTPAVFVSHSSADADLAMAFVRVLRAAFGLDNARLRCTSARGYGLPPGVHVAETLRQELTAADICLAILTPNSLKSTYVLFELGARWAVSRHVVPVIARGTRPESLPAPLAEVNAATIADEGDVGAILDRFATLLGSNPARSSELTRASRELVRIATGHKPRANAGRSGRAGTLDPEVIFGCFGRRIAADGGYVDPDIPPVVVFNARERFAFGRERILVFIDNSRAGVDGLAVTVRGIYWRNTQHDPAEFLSWEDLSAPKITSRDDEIVIIGDKQIALTFRDVSAQYVARALRCCVAAQR